MRRLLQRQDWFTQEKSARILTAVIEHRPKKSTAFSNGVLSTDSAAGYGGPDPAEQHISTFTDWLVGQLKRPSNPAKSVAVATSMLAVLLKERGCRQLLVKAGGVQPLLAQLKISNSPANSQLLYELCLCIWQLTFMQQAAEALGTAGRYHHTL